MITKMTPITTGNVKGTLWCCSILMSLLFFTVPCDGRTAIRIMLPDTKSLKYLSRHGYLPPLNSSEGEIISKEALSEAISELQSEVGIPATGELDVATIRHMSIPRCAINDKRRIARNAEWEEYRLWDGEKWHHEHITYKIFNYPPRLQPKEVDEEISKAFRMWANHTFLTVEQVFDGKADIDISFDKSVSDGPGETLAEASSPGSGCSIIFDAVENWTINSYRGTNLLQVAAHEFGHTLGIDHSRVKSAVMWPQMSGYDPNFKLHIDDIKAVQHLYGVKSGGESEDPDLQEDDHNKSVDDESKSEGESAEPNSGEDDHDTSIENEVESGGESVGSERGIDGQNRNIIIITYPKYPTNN